MAKTHNTYIKYSRLWQKPHVPLSKRSKVIGKIHFGNQPDK